MAIKVRNGESGTDVTVTPSGTAGPLIYRVENGNVQVYVKSLVSGGDTFYVPCGPPQPEDPGASYTACVYGYWRYGQTA